MDTALKTPGHESAPEQCCGCGSLYRNAADCLACRKRSEGAEDRLERRALEGAKLCGGLLTGWTPWDEPKFDAQLRPEALR